MSLRKHITQISEPYTMIKALYKLTRLDVPTRKRSSNSKSSSLHILTKLIS
ncbi:hypothetical protein [Candidatus Enterovibrio altilux]|uniref:hypothetical protein n=1 Tax=Candidatus Enterovibrio altilux TaxID=1927128 RepID=UPI0013747E9F|nr:hypothetical protein [Candidatus Enterovibrio luxaltus]